MKMVEEEEEEEQQNKITNHERASRRDVMEGSGFLILTTFLLWYFSILASTAFSLCICFSF